MAAQNNSYLFITEYFPENGNDITGGVEARTYNIARLLAKNNQVAVLCSYQQGKQRQYELEGIRVFRVGIHHPYTNRGAIASRLCLALALFLNAVKLIYSQKPKIIIGENFISYLPTFFAGLFSKGKVMATYHETWLGEWIKNKGLLTGICGATWERLVLTLPWAQIISVSQFTKERLVKNGIPEEKINVIRNGINLSSFKTVQANKADDLTICNISRLTPHKRVDDLIKAVAELKKDVPQIKCHIIGTGDEIDNLKNLASQLDVTANIHFHGFVKDHDQVVNLLKSSHIFCSPSVLEGFGIVVIEAAALGIPYVISDIPPFVEVSQNGKGGMIFKQNDVQDLVEKLEAMLTNKTLYNKLESAVSELAHDYDWEHIVKENFE